MRFDLNHLLSFATKLPMCVFAYSRTGWIYCSANLLFHDDDDDDDNDDDVIDP